MEKALESMQKSSPLEKFDLICKMDRVFQSKESSEIGVSQLKQALKTHSPLGSWRSAILSPSFERKIQVFFPFQSYQNHLEHPLSFEERVQAFPRDEMSTLFGSTFSTNKPHRLNTTGDHLLDSAYGGSCPSSKKSCKDYVLAIGDGSGGHFGDSSQDKRIAKVSNLATKWSSEIISSYTDPDNLKKEIPKIISVLDTALQDRIWGEGTTLLCCRVFSAKKGYRVVGFNIGDSMLCNWSFANHKLKTLAPAQVSEAGTAIFPSAYRSEEINVFDALISSDSALLLMTDGVHDTLPHIEKEGTYSNELRFRIRKLKELDHALQSCPKGLDEILAFLMKRSFEGAEELRKSFLSKKDVQIGDDGAILGCLLPL